jgi:hypothetical protein
MTYGGEAFSWARALLLAGIVGAVIRLKLVGHAEPPELSQPNG